MEAFKTCVKELILFLGQKIVWIDIPELHENLCALRLAAAGCRRAIDCRAGTRLAPHREHASAHCSAGR